MWPEFLLSLFLTTGRPFVNFHQLSLWPGDLQSTSVYIQCNQEIFHQLLSTFLESRETFCQLPCTFHVAVGLLVNFLHSHWTFRQLFVPPWGLPSTFHAVSGNSQLPSPFCVHGELLSAFRNSPCGCGTSFNFCQLLEELWHLPSTFCAATGPSFTVSCGRGTFNQLSMRPRDIPSTFLATAGPSINFLCCHGSFRLLLSTFSYDPSSLNYSVVR